MDYLLDLGLSREEINNIDSSLIECLSLFPLVVKENFDILNELNLTNEHEVFVNHLKMFLMNPDKLRNIFGKYDRADLIRCLEKNHKVIEKL